MHRIFNTLFSIYASPFAGAVFLLLILYFTQNKSLLQFQGYIDESACRGGLLGVFPYEWIKSVKPHCQRNMYIGTFNS